MATNEGLVLDTTVDFNSAALSLEGFDCPPPSPRPEWAQGADADGALLVRDPLFENREVTARVRVTQTSTMDLALAQLLTISNKLQESEQRPDGLPLVWTPAGSTKTFTFYVLTYSIEGMPIQIDGADAGWLVRSPVITIKMICKPFAYGAEVLYGTSTTSSDILPTLVVSSIPGDVPAEGRLIVTDLATQSRRHLEWGLEWRYYNASTSLVVESDNMVTSGFAGVGTTRAGAYDPGATGNSVVRCTLVGVGLATAVCGTGNLSHVGTFRVKARVYMVAASATVPVYVRLSWREGDGPLAANAWTTPVINNNWAEIDLGLITIPANQLGTQRWTGQIEASGAAADTIDIDTLELMPAAEGYGKATNISSTATGVINAYDQFTGIAATTVLNARVAPAGGTWATSGVAATDFAAADAPLATDETEMRLTTVDGSRRFAILGATTYTDTEVRVSVTTAGALSSGAGVFLGAIARWVDASNYLAAYITSDGLTVEKVVAGVTTTLSFTAFIPPQNGTWGTIRLASYANGVWVAQLTAASGGYQYASVSGQDAVLATAGALASGKPGFFDRNGGASTCTRYYDNFYHAVPAPEQIVIYSGRLGEIRSDGTLRQDSTGTYYGRMPNYRGSRLLIPPSGDQARSARIAVKARRNNVDLGADDQITDSTKIELRYTPRYLGVGQ